MTRKVAVEKKVAEGRRKVAEAKKKGGGGEEKGGREDRARNKGEEGVPVKLAEEEMMRRVRLSILQQCG